MVGMDTLEDGTVLHAPRGELPHDPLEDRVQCHFCGAWYRKLGPHLRRHGLTADDYRREVGLRPRHPLQPPSLSERQAAVARELVTRHPSVRAAVHRRP
jgi:predicted transcriptional regulator